MGINPKRLVPFQLVPFQLVLKQVGSNKLERHLFEQIVCRLEPNESTFCPLNGSRPDEMIRSALDYGDLSETFACAFGQSSWNGTSRPRLVILARPAAMDRSRNRVTAIGYRRGASAQG